MVPAVARSFFVSIVSLFFVSSVASSPRIKVIKLAVTNPSDQTRLAEHIVLNVAELKRIAPNFKAGDAIVTTSNAATLEEDARILETTELPSQADDLDDDRKLDELVFQIDLQPRQTRVVTIAFGEAATIARLRTEYQPRTHAKFTMRFDGLAGNLKSMRGESTSISAMRSISLVSDVQVSISNCLDNLNIFTTKNRPLAGIFTK